MPGYDGDAFNDPVVRCDDCGNLVHRIYVSKRGSCNHCGNRRFKNVQQFSEEEMKKIKDKTYDFHVKRWQIDPAFLALFSAVSEVEE